MTPQTLERTYTNFIEALCEKVGCTELSKPLVEGFGHYVENKNVLCEGLLNKIGKAAAIGSLAFNAANASAQSNDDNPFNFSHATTQQMIGGSPSLNANYMSDSEREQKLERLRELEAKQKMRKRYAGAIAMAMQGHPETMEKFLLADFKTALRNGNNTDDIKKQIYQFSRAFDTNTFGKMLEIEADYEQESPEPTLESVYTNFVENLCKTTNHPDVSQPLIKGFHAYYESAFGEKLKRVGKSALTAGMVAAAPFISGCAGNQYATHHPRTIEEIDAEIARLKAQIAERESPCSRSTPEYQAAKYDYIMNGDRSGLDAYAARCNHGSRNTPEYRAAMNDWVMNGDRSGLH